MRVTADSKVATRERILKVAARQLLKRGWERTTTRAIARSSGIAAGTLFNYFPSKESLAAEIVIRALRAATEEADRERTAQQTLEEDLFSFIWTGLRHLRPYREFLRPAIDTLLSPLARSAPDHPGEPIRHHHLQGVEAILSKHQLAPAASAVWVQLYWALYLGVLAHWTADDSRNQVQTQVVLDQSVNLLAVSLRAQRMFVPEPEENKEESDVTQTG